MPHENNQQQNHCPTQRPYFEKEIQISFNRLSQVRTQRDPNHLYIHTPETHWKRLTSDRNKDQIHNKEYRQKIFRIQLPHHIRVKQIYIYIHTFENNFLIRYLARRISLMTEFAFWQRKRDINILNKQMHMNQVGYVRLLQCTWPPHADMLRWKGLPKSGMFEIRSLLHSDSFTG